MAAIDSMTTISDMAPMTTISDMANRVRLITFWVMFGVLGCF